MNNSYFWLFMNNPNFSPYLLTAPPMKMWPATADDRVVSNMLSSYCCHLHPPSYFYSPLLNPNLGERKFSSSFCFVFFLFFLFCKNEFIRKMMNQNLKIMMKNNSIPKAKRTTPFLNYDEEQHKFKKFENYIRKLNRNSRI